MRLEKLIAGLLFASLLLSACSVVPGAAPTATPTASEEVPTPNDAPILPPKAALAAQQLLAEQLNLPVEDVTIALIEETEWSDSCLGLGGPAESCLQAITPGYRVVLNAGGKDYEFRTDREGDAVRAVPGQSSGGGTAAGETVAGETVRRLLARRLGVDVSEIELVSAEAVEWQDSCLGYGSPVELCLQAVTPGYKVIVKTGGATYEFHTDLEVLRIRSQGGYEEFTSLPPAALEEIARQLNAPLPDLKVTSSERVDWPDSCFGVPPPNRVCITGITPGWRVLLEYKGVDYEFRTDMNGTTAIQYTGEANPAGETGSLVWQIEGETCREARFNADIMRYGVCNGADLQEVKLNAELAKELAFLVETYEPFTAHTPSGTVIFAGQGSQTPTLAQERAFAEWARMARSTAEATTGNPEGTPLLSWSRQGGFAGFCDTLSIDSAGFARAASCKATPAAEYQPVQVTAKDLETLYDWMDSYGPFTFVQKDAATADAMTVELQFTGRGRQAVTDDWKRAAQIFAADLYISVQQRPQ